MFLINKKKYLALLPLLILILFLLTFALLKTFQLSLVKHSNISLDNYLRLINDQELISSFAYSFYIASLSSIISIVLGVFLALQLFKTKNKYLIKFISFIPIIIPHLIACMLIIAVFSQTGLLSRIMYHLGFIKEANQFIPLINTDNGIGIILTYVYKELCFVTLIVLNILNTINKKEILVARMLKANNLEIFKKIVFPKIIAPLILVFIVLFAYAFSSYEVPSILASSSSKMISSLMYYYYSNIALNSKEYAMAISVVMILFLLLVTSICLLCYNKIKRRYHL